MTFVWNTTCRRLQSSGELARFAEGHATERESREIETHLAACPSCQAIVADTLMVADLLKGSASVAPAKGRAASGNLWKTLEGEIARTPQDRVPVPRTSAPTPVSAPRLQRFGRWLAMPGAMPFGAAAAAAVIGMVGVFAFGRMDFAPVEKQTASVTSDAKDAEFTLLPPPGAPASIGAGAQAKINATSRESSARERAAAPLAPRTVAAVTAEAVDNEIAPLKDKISVRRSRSQIGSAPLPLSAVAPRPVALRVSAVQMAKAASSEYFAADTAAPPAPAASAQVAEDGRPEAAAGGFGGSSSARNSSSTQFNDSDGYLKVTPAPAMVAKARVVPAPAPAVQGAVAFVTAPGSSESLSGEGQDVPAARSLLDMALRQRRQRSLFSYATR